MAGCPTCGIDESAISVHDAIDAVRTFPGRYRRAVAGLTDAQLRARPSADVWSVLEYLVHIREVLDLLGMTIPHVLDQPGVELPDISADESAQTRPDWVMDPGLALDGIDRAALTLVTAAADVSEEAWSRPFTIGGTPHDAGWLVRHAAHEGAHHLRDIERVRAA
ncbi:MAG: DinB family protein [Acidimicrobiia bacterium]